MSWDWVVKALPTILEIGGSIYESSQNSKTADENLSLVNQANDASLAAQKEANNQAIGTISKNQEALYEQQDQAAPGIYQQQQAIANQYILTPAQQKAIEDARTQSVTQMAASGLRGSGRATAAAVKDVEGTLKNQYLDANRNRADSAASALSSQYFNSGNNAVNQGEKVAGYQAGYGDKVAGTIGQNAANTAATNTLNTGYQTEGYGRIASTIKDQINGNNVNPNNSATTAPTQTRAINDINSFINDYVKKQNTTNSTV